MFTHRDYPIKLWFSFLNPPTRGPSNRNHSSASPLITARPSGTPGVPPNPSLPPKWFLALTPHTVNLSGTPRAPPQSLVPQGTALNAGSQLNIE